LLQHLRRERHDLHVALLAQLPRDGAEDVGGRRLPGVVDQDRGVLVEADIGAVLAPGLLGRPDDHRLGYVALLHLAGRDRVLDGHHHGVAEAGVPALAAAQHPDHQRLAGARVVGDAENGLLLNHVFLWKSYQLSAIGYQFWSRVSAISAISSDS
jgi:hypothetical protein